MLVSEHLLAWQSLACWDCPSTRSAISENPEKSLLLEPLVFFLQTVKVCRARKETNMMLCTISRELLAETYASKPPWPPIIEVHHTSIKFVEVNDFVQKITLKWRHNTNLNSNFLGGHIESSFRFLEEPMKGLKWSLSFNSSRPNRQTKKLWIDANVRNQNWRAYCNLTSYTYAPPTPLA